MKRLLLFSVISIFCLTISAQTKTWIGPSGGNFSLAANWNPAGVPTSTNDVIIPTGSNVVIDVSASIKSLVMQENAIIATSATITFTNASTIAANAIFNLSQGGLSGSGTLTNNGTFNITGNDNKTFGSSVTLLNNGTINFNGTGSLILGFGSPTLNNAASGVINLNTDSAFDYTQGVGTVINSGLIRRLQGSGLFTIYTHFQNNDGTITVEAGTLKLDYSNSILTDGTYNVTSGNTLEWANGFTLLGTLTGQLDGQIDWTGNMAVASGTEAVLDFSGPTGVNWTSGSFGGNGTLTNMGILNFVSATGKSVSGQSILNNEDTIILMEQAS